MLSVSATVNLPLCIEYNTHKVNSKKRLIGSLSNTIYLMPSVGKMFESKESAKLSTLSKSIPKTKRITNIITATRCVLPQFSLSLSLFSFLFLFFFFWRKSNAPNNFVLFRWGSFFDFSFCYSHSLWPNVTWVSTINTKRKSTELNSYLFLPTICVCFSVFFFAFYSVCYFYFISCFRFCCCSFVWFATKQSRWWES